MRPHPIVFVIAAACGGRSEPHAPTTSVVLDAPGQAPQRALRYQPKPGDREVKLHLEVMTFVAAVHLESPDPVRYRFHGLRQEADPRVFDKMIDDAVAHVSGTIAGDLRGRAAASTDTGVYHTTPEFAPVFEEAIVAFPEEAVGVGARWRTSSRVGDGTTLALEVELTGLTATAATVHEHGTAKDASGEATLDVTATVGFDHLIPQKARIQVDAPLPGATKPIALVFTLD